MVAPHARRFFGRFPITARCAVAVALAFAVLHGRTIADKWQPNTWLYRDGAFYFTTLRALAETGSLEQRALQPESWYLRDLGWNRDLGDDWSNVSLGKNGGWYPKHPVLLPLLAVPLYLLFGPTGTLAINVLLNFVFVLLVFLVCRRLCRPEPAAIAAVAIAALPFVREQSYAFSNDVLSAVLLLGTIELTLAKRFAWAGILCGLALWSRVMNVAFVPGLGVIVLEAGGGVAVRRAAAFALIPLGIYGALNTWMFGAPWITSYQRVMVRQQGTAIVASHVRLFRVPFMDGLRKILLGGDYAGAWSLCWPLVPGAVGLVLLFRRRVLLALGLALFGVLPILAFATYDWYRPHFLNAVFGVSAVGLAALAGRVLPPKSMETLPTPGWRISMAVALAVLLMGVVVRTVRKPNPQLLSSHVKQARVFLGDIPCDYFNPNAERWECSHEDPGSWAMTGSIPADAESVNGQPRRGVWMHPSPSRRWRSMVFPTLPGRHLTVDFALGDVTHAGVVEIELRPRGNAPIVLELSRPGEVSSQSVDLQAGPGNALEIRVRSSDPEWKHLVFEGRLNDA